MLELILQYDMTKDEAKAWKIAIMYLELAKKYFPEYSHYRFVKGDPRRSSLFKYCYKLLRESNLADNEYRLYLAAQFQIIKNIDYGTGHAFIQPNCIVGPKAWKRWLLWKEKFFKPALQKPEPVAPRSASNITIKVDECLDFLKSKFSELNKECIINSLENRNIFRWCALGELPGYYLVLSPLVKQWIAAKQIDLLDKFALDLAYYRKGVTQEVEDYFKSKFKYEFK